MKTQGNIRQWDSRPQEEYFTGPEMHLNGWIRNTHHFSDQLSQKKLSGKPRPYV